MKESTASPGGSRRGRGFRKCLRAGMNSRTGRVAGVSSVLVPIVSYVVYDLQQPDSTVKKLASAVTSRLVTWRDSNRQLKDISSKVEVVASEDNA